MRHVIAHGRGAGARSFVDVVAEVDDELDVLLREVAERVIEAVESSSGTTRRRSLSSAGAANGHGAVRVRPARLIVRPCLEAVPVRRVRPEAVDLCVDGVGLVRCRLRSPRGARRGGSARRGRSRSARRTGVAGMPLVDGQRGSAPAGSRAPPRRASGRPTPRRARTDRRPAAEGARGQRLAGPAARNASGRRAARAQQRAPADAAVPVARESHGRTVPDTGGVCGAERTQSGGLRLPPRAARAAGRRRASSACCASPRPLLALRHLLEPEQREQRVQVELHGLHAHDQLGRQIAV